MFHDERINTEQGRAFRATIILAWIITAIYGILHGVYMLVNGNLRITSLIVELFCGIGGVLILSYGEIRYLFARKDEMISHSKNQYYAKAFYWFLYLLLFAYCIRVPFYLANDTNDFAPNHILFALELPCWFLLLLYFKCRNVSFNYSVIEENRKTYVHRVIANIGKLGELTAIFTCFSAMLWLLIADNEITQLLSGLLSVLLSGLISWLSLSFEYALFSWAEWKSDHAKEHNRVSATTIIFLWLGVVCYLGYGAFGVIGVWDHGSYITNSAGAVLISSFSKYFSLLQSYFFGLFTIYLYSEIKYLKEKRLDFTVKFFMWLQIVEYALSAFTTIIISTLSKIGEAALITWNSVNNFLSFMTFILHIILLFTVISVFVKRDILKKTAYIYPILLLLCGITLRIWAQYAWMGTLSEKIIMPLFVPVFGIGITYLCRKNKFYAVPVNGTDQKEEL